MLSARIARSEIFRHAFSGRRKILPIGQAFTLPGQRGAKPDGPRFMSSSSAPNDSYEEFKKSFMVSSAHSSSGIRNNVPTSAAGLGTPTNDGAPSLDALSPEVLRIMLDESIRRRDIETLRMLVVEAHSLGKLRSELLTSMFQKCFVFRHATTAGSAGVGVGTAGQALVHPDTRRSYMEMASFLLLHSISSTAGTGGTASQAAAPPVKGSLNNAGAGAGAGAAIGRINASPADCQFLLSWLVENGKWFQGAAVLEHMIREGFALDNGGNGSNAEAFLIGTGLMRNTLGVTRLLQLLTTVVEHRRSDLCELFSYSKMNRYALSMGSRFSFELPHRRDMEAQPLHTLSSALLHQLEHEQWFSFGVSKTLVALACGSQHHEIAADFVNKSVELVDRMNRLNNSAAASSPHRDVALDGAKDRGKGRLSNLSDLLSSSLSPSPPPSDWQAEADEAGLPRAHTRARHGSSSNNIDVLSMLRAFSQGAGVASKDANSFKDEDQEAPVMQVLLDLSVKCMNQQTRINTMLSNTAAASASASASAATASSAGSSAAAGSRGDSPSKQQHNNNLQQQQLQQFVSGPVHAVGFFKMLWVLLYRVNKSSANRFHRFFVGGDASTPDRRDPALEPEAISDSYPRVRFDAGAQAARVGSSAASSVSSNAPSGDGASASAIAPLISDTYMASTYRQLTGFLADDSVQQMTCSPAPGYHRRLLRYLCDELGLRHKIVELIEEKAGGIGDTRGVRVWKENTDSGRHADPKPLADILNLDSRRSPNLRKFDGLPQHWHHVEGFMSSLDTSTLREVCLQTTGAMKAAYPSAEWGLLMAQALRDAEAGYPPGLLRNIYNMATNRSDIYGLLEVVYANEEVPNMNMQRHAKRVGSARARGSIIVDGVEYAEDEARAAGLTRIKSVAQRLAEAAAAEAEAEAAGHRDKASKMLANATSQIIASGDVRFPSEDNDRSQAQLRNHDWNRICHAAFHCRLSDLPKASFREAYTEVMRLMRNAGVDLDDSTMRTLLRFLVHTEPSAELIARILRRMYQDEQVQLTHIECTALSQLIMARIPRMDAVQIQLARPTYKTENYLFVFPGALTAIVQRVAESREFLGEHFLARFENVWDKAHSPWGRGELYRMVSELVAFESPSRARLIKSASDDDRHTVMLLGMYAAYLVGANDDLVFPKDRSSGSGGGYRKKRAAAPAPTEFPSEAEVAAASASRYRRAFDLLYMAETVHHEAQQHQRDAKDAEYQSMAKGQGQGQGRDEEQEQASQRQQYDARAQRRA